MEVCDIYGFYKDANGYVVTKNGGYYLHTTTQEAAAEIVDKLMEDERKQNERLH